jgi:hypothetical protein
MAKQPWRFQGDIAYGETDPVVTVFMGEPERDGETGEMVIRQDARNPVTMKLSELKSAAHLANAKTMQTLADAQSTARAADLASRKEAEA